MVIGLQALFIVGIGTYVCIKSRKACMIVMHVNINKREGERMRNRPIYKFQAGI